VIEFRFLGYTFNERATDKAQMRELVKKANMVVGCVWGIGERKWGGREECRRSKLRVKAGKKVAKFEDRMGEREECRILSEYYGEKKKKADAKESAELSERDKDPDKQKRRERIRESRFNREYERCITEDVPAEHPLSGVPGEREREREKSEGEIQMWERREREQVLDGKRREVPRGTGPGRNTERRRKGDRMDESDMEEERKDRKRKEWRIEKNVNFLELYFCVCN
jgi:hypothetical protein